MRVVLEVLLVLCAASHISAFSGWDNVQGHHRFAREAPKDVGQVAPEVGDDVSCTRPCPVIEELKNNSISERMQEMKNEFQKYEALLQKILELQTQLHGHEAGEVQPPTPDSTKEQDTTEVAEIQTQPSVEDYGNLSLYEAIEKGNLNAVKHLIEIGSNINEHYHNGPLLALAIKKGDISIIKYLLDKGARINQKFEFIDYDIYDRPKLIKLAPLHAAIRLKKYDIAKLLIGRKANIDVKDSIGETVLHYAVDSRNIDMLSYVIKNGADINIQMPEGNTALHMAVSKDNTGAVTILLQNGADTSIENGRGDTPLALAMKGRNPDMVDLIISNDSANNKSDNSLIFQLVEGLRGYDEDTTVEMLKVLIKHQNNTLDSTYEDGKNTKKTALIAATIKDSREIMKLLLKSGANVNGVATGSQSTPLHMAAKYQKVEAFKLLLKYGASVTAKDEDGLTPLDRLPPITRQKITKLYPQLVNI